MKRNFINQNHQNNQKRKLFEGSFEDVKEKVQETDSFKNVKSAYDNYANMNQQQLMKELVGQVNESKKNGTFDFEKLNSSIEQLSPMLDKSQIEKMKQILGNMK